MNKARKTLLILSALLLVAFGSTMVSDKEPSFTLASTSKTFIAGTPIVLAFNSKSEKEKPQLYIIHSYGKTLLDATLLKGKYVCKIPENYCQKTGAVSWFLVNNNKTTNSGTFEIIPNDKTKTVIENYLGPRTILAGGKEFTMMVTVPTDSYDNPKADNTSVGLKYQFIQNITSLNLKTKDFIAWYEIYSPTKSGKMLVSSECDAIVSKEIESEVYPNIATNFTINYARNHEFADGNQITRFSTSIIQDQFGNTVSDGTLVSFIIKTKNNMVLKTFGTTINGMATAQILHPDHQDIYSVKGYISGIAESNSIVINYKPIIATFNYSFSNKNRTITIGPIKSFMSQLVPDGIKVVLKVFNQNKEVSTLQEETSKGMATFELAEDFYKRKSYYFEITTLGVTQKTTTLNYDH